MPTFDEPNEPGTDGAEIRRVVRLGIGRPLEVQVAEMPNAGRSSELSLVREEAQNRLYQVYNGPVGEVVSRDIANKSCNASRVIETSTADGPIDLKLNEPNIRGMLTWALAEAGLKREDRQTLINKMEEMGIGSPVTVGPARNALASSLPDSSQDQRSSPDFGRSPAEQANAINAIATSLRFTEDEARNSIAPRNQISSNLRTLSKGVGSGYM